MRKATRREKEAYRQLRLVGAMLELMRDDVEAPAAAGRAAAGEGIDGAAGRDVAEAVEKNLRDKQRWPYEDLARRRCLPVDKNEFGRRKKRYAEAFLRELKRSE